MPLAFNVQKATAIELNSVEEAVSFLLLQQLIARKKQTFMHFPPIPVRGLERTLRDLVESLVLEGCAFPWRRLDQGANAKVFELPCGNVLRMCFHKRDGTFYFHQKCALYWEEGRASPWMPRVHMTFCLEQFLYVSVLEKVIALPYPEDILTGPTLPTPDVYMAYWEQISLPPEERLLTDVETVLQMPVPTSFKVLYIASMCLTLHDLSFLKEQVGDTLMTEIDDSMAAFMDIFTALFEFFENKSIPQVLDCWTHNMGLRPGSLDLVLLDPLCPM